VTNLNSDDTLPPYYIIRNCIVIACALDNWTEANIWRLSVEQTYSTCLDKARRRNDEDSLKALENLRKELDELTEFMVEDMTGLTREERSNLDQEDINMETLEEAMADLEDEDTAGIDFEDLETVAQAEDEVGVSADAASSPICCLNGTGSNIAPTLNIVSPTEDPKPLV
jgi:hypothetical protein